MENMIFLARDDSRSLWGLRCYSACGWRELRVMSIGGVHFGKSAWDLERVCGRQVRILVVDVEPSQIKVNDPS